MGSAFVTCSLPLASLGYTGAPTSTSTHLPYLSVAYNLSLFYTHSLSLFYTNPSLYYTSTLSLSCTHTISHTHNLSNLDIHSLCLTHTPLTLTHLITLSLSFTPTKLSSFSCTHSLSLTHIHNTLAVVCHSPVHKLSFPTFFLSRVDSCKKNFTLAHNLLLRKRSLLFVVVSVETREFN